MNLKDLTILVGKNNAGKSTLIEALRIASIVTNRLEYLNFTPAPSWVTEDANNGVSPSLNNLNISTKNIFHQYGKPPASIEVIFSNETRILVFVGPEAEVFALIFDTDGSPIINKRSAKLVEIPQINILPQISPVLEDETILKYETVRSNLMTRLTSRHFRNQIKLFPEYYTSFKELSEKTWDNLQIKPVEYGSGFEGEPIFLWIRDGGFEAEVGWMGHGLQMWLQTMWFLARSSGESTVILDEPDVYMHADLQRRLIRLIKPMFRQIIIATHSVEIMAEVESENILPVDNKKNQLQYANRNQVVQKIINEIGSVHNIEIVRLFSSGKMLIVEGDKDDVKILGLLQNVIFPQTHVPFDIIPKTFVEGWGGWQRVIGSNNVFQHTSSDIKTYCIFDSDYYLDEEKNARYQDAIENKINLHIWERKEIENYLINPNVIFRVIQKRKRKGSIILEEVDAKIKEFSEELKSQTIGCFANIIQANNKGIVASTAYERAESLIAGKWKNPSHIVCGKDLISKLSGWSKERFNTSFNAFILAREFRKEEICIEMRNVISQIETGENFTPLS